MLDNRYALLFIRGERPVMDFKYDIMKHPDIRMTADGKMDPYIHGESWDVGASIELVYDSALLSETIENAQDDQLMNSDYALLSEEDVEKLVAEEEEERSKNQENYLSYRNLTEV